MVICIPGKRFIAMGILHGRFRGAQPFLAECQCFGAETRAILKQPLLALVSYSLVNFASRNRRLYIREPPPVNIVT